MALAVVLFLLGVFPSQAPAEPFLVAGIRQVQDGDFDSAVFTLDTAVRRLAGQKHRRPELVQAYVYLGVAYVGLGHDSAARGKFRAALELYPSLRLEPDGKVLEIRLTVPDSPEAEKALMLLAECNSIVLDVTRHPVQGRLEMGE